MTQNVLYYVSLIILIITMSNKSLAIFNPFSLQSGPKGPLQSRTQEIIWYAESRFRHVLLQIDRANFLKQQWMQKNLYFELVR